MSVVSKRAPLSGPFDVPLDPANIQSYGQCTYWVEEKRPELITNAVQKFGGGNAFDWKRDAAAAGYLIDHTPRVGDVAAYPPGTYLFTQSDGVFWSAGEVGHVAYVERVDPDGSFVISEMNVTSPLHGDIALAPATSAAGAYFIHLPGSLPTPSVTIRTKTPAVSEKKKSVKVTVTRSGSVTDALTVYYLTKGSAAAGKHYGKLSGALTIPAGSKTGTIDIQPKSDRSSQANHLLKLALQMGRGYQIAAPASASISILDAE